MYPTLILFILALVALWFVMNKIHTSKSENSGCALAA